MTVSCRSRLRTAAALPVVLGIVFVTSACTASGPLATPPTVVAVPVPDLTVSGRTVQVTSGSTRMDLDTTDLGMWITTGKRLTVSEPTPHALGPSTVPQVSGGAVTWRYEASGTEVEARPDRATGGVRLRFHAADGVRLEWPRTATDASVGAVQYANGSGQDVPVRDRFWNDTGAGLIGSSFAFAGDLTLPAWGVTGPHGTVGAGFSTSTDIGTDLAFASVGGVVQATATHTFSADAADYDVVVTPTDGSPVGSAVAYRRTLLAADGIATLDEKARRNPEVRALLGAPHAYVWGSGRTAAAVDALRKAGIDRMWLGYDADGDVPDRSFVEAAARAQFLVGPYDSWANAQDPATSDASTSTWPGTLFPDGCVRDASGEVQIGFGGRGCYLSSTALDQAQRTDRVIDQRVGTMTANGATSYFLDVDAAGQLFADSTPTHRQTPADDRALRLARMRALADGGYGPPVVLGSESAAAWANPAIAFSHGSSTPTFDGLWAAEQDREAWGAYWPEERPGFFFKPTEISTALARAMFAPEYRVPLYETVLHDSVVSTDRWEIGIGKLPQVRTERVLTSMLYDEPVMHTLDGEDIAANAEQLASEQSFFRALQRAAGTKPMTDYRRLTPDGSVQQTTFGPGDLTVTANFGSAAAHGVQPGCVAAVSADRALGSYCP